MSVQQEGARTGRQRELNGVGVMVLYGERLECRKALRLPFTRRMVGVMAKGERRRLSKKVTRTGVCH